MKKSKSIYVGILICINLFFSACTSTAKNSNETVPVEDRSATYNPSQVEVSVDQEARTVDPEPAAAEMVIENNHREESITEQSSSPVALAFLNDADKYSTSGDSARAVASLERGLDIEPKNPWLWNRLASEHLKQKMWSKAITLAKKSNAFASGHNQLQRDNWQIIAEARMALGDAAGAKEAQIMVERFSRETT